SCRLAECGHDLIGGLLVDGCGGRCRLALFFLLAVEQGGWGGIDLLLLFASALAAFSAALVVQSLLFLLGVAFVVEFQEATEDFKASDFADSESTTIFGFVETVTKFEIMPTVCNGNGFVHFDVK